MARSISLSLLLLTAAIAFLASPVVGQRRGTVEVGLFAQRAAFDELTELAFGTAPGIGGLAGFYVFTDLMFEVGTSYAWTETAAAPVSSASWRPSRGRLVYSVPVTEDFYPLVGAGLVRNAYGRGVDGADTGVSALLGFKTYVRDRVAFRSDLTLDFVGAPFNEGAPAANSPVSSHLNWSLTAGLSIDVRRGRFQDSDRDLVRDRRDACPDTPLGVGVDESGCRLDSDGDGVFDEDDACPGTPFGVGVDSVGCRTDTDGDSVFDEDDRCPATPVGVTVDVAGCALDSDLDGVPDFRDQCPNTPPGVRVEVNGCRIDTDQDGVFDEDDACPGTPLGTEVDVAGCPVLFVQFETVLILEGVTFETASANLTPEAMSVLDRIAESLIAISDVRVRVNGHTDATGSRAYNMNLSEARARSVMGYLAGRGVSADRMESQGFGPDVPVATNDTEEGRQQNRRVELERIN